MAEKVRIPNNNNGEIDHKQLGELTQFLASIPMNYWSAPQIAEILMRNGWIKDNFEAERTPADDVTTITRLIMGCQTLDPVAIAKYLVQNGVSAKS